MPSRVPTYICYVDDLLLLADDAAHLGHARQEVAAWLAAERALDLKGPQATVRSCREPLHALGLALSRDGLRALPRAKRKLRAAASSWVFTGEPSRVSVARSLAARIGNLMT